MPCCFVIFQDVSTYPTFIHLSLMVACLVATIFLLVLSLIETIFNRIHALIAIATVLCAVSMVTIGNLFADWPAPMDGVPVVYVMILVIYLVLPLSRWWIVGMGTGVGIGHVILGGIRSRLVVALLAEQVI